MLIWWLVTDKEKRDVSGWFTCETIRMCTWTVCNSVIDKFAVVVLFLKDSMILLMI